MSDTVIKVENLSKHYNLGTIGTGTLYRDIQSFWARLRGKEDPNTQIGTWDASQMDQDNSFWALKDVSFEVKQGDVVGIIGRNGAGKSTLLKILSRVTGPTSGNIKIKGRVASLLEVGTGFHPELTGRENVYLNGTILGMRKAEIDKKFDEIVAFAEIEKFIDTPVKRYSSGMYVRLAFAVAAHLDPEILIVDEVLAVGDAEFQKKCLGKMGEVSKQGRTVLFVSHNLTSIIRLCNKGIILQKGKIVDSGDIQRVVKKYMAQHIQQDKGIYSFESENLRKNSLENSNFKWKSAKIYNSIGETTNVICLEESFTIEIEGYAYKDIDRLKCGMGIISPLGFPLFNSQWNNGMLEQCKVKKGIVKFSIEFNHNIFIPGEYTIDFGANAIGAIDWIPEAIVLIINDLKRNGTGMREDFMGAILPICKWKTFE